ncbi:hypothetical protein [Bacteroides cellulosilyticus]|uniref:hypothetical protein n=1 Tax=Bacteroides cellulosilyticus TaxID=246787 RepID=UPI00356423F9
MMEGKKQFDMNTVDCTVLEVLSPPYEKYGCWCVDVKYNSWGNISNGTVNVFSEKEATKVEIGYVFQA